MTPAHIGSIGDRIIARVKFIKRINRSHWKHNDRPQHLYLLRDAVGRLITMYNGATFPIDGEWWVLTGVIKKHSVFCGNPQTNVQYKELAWSPRKKSNNGISTK